LKKLDFTASQVDEHNTLRPTYLRDQIYKMYCQLVRIREKVNVSSVSRRVEILNRINGLLAKLEKAGEASNLLTDDVEAKKRNIGSLKSKFARYLALKEVVESFSEHLELDEIASLIIEKATKTLGKPGRALVFLVNAERQELRLCASTPDAKSADKNGDIFDLINLGIVPTYRAKYVNAIAARNVSLGILPQIASLKNVTMIEAQQKFYPDLDVSARDVRARGGGPIW